MGYLLVSVPSVCDIGVVNDADAKRRRISARKTPSPAKEVSEKNANKTISAFGVRRGCQSNRGGKREAAIFAET